MAVRRENGCQRAGFVLSKELNAAGLGCFALCHCRGTSVTAIRRWKGRTGKEGKRPKGNGGRALSSVTVTVISGRRATAILRRRGGGTRAAGTGSRYGHLEKMTDLVAVWEVALSDGIHKIEFEHGTTSGKRVVYVDGKEEIRKEWMFKLVGKETFTVGASKTRATINIDAVSGFAYEYTLEINGKSLKKYMENRSKTTNTWVLSLGGTDYRVVLEKDTMDVWCNGKKMETAGEFVEDGTETHFSVGDHSCYIKAVSSGKRKEGIIHTLIVDDREIPEAVE
ncbi:fas apoptotic inhibitory molecule 1 isoform X1 [Tympanuchus pallidicinctus]|uniref:fas apoptotic inhibitory molecule 1 isoform X1 n=2 Tax=Tetraoninae TaxID=466585 RepID=UPI0022875BA1|nr:fas apoptotic inhibitory molecule 1 isoform X1 [Tympanuchus pallidicinctus]